MLAGIVALAFVGGAIGAMAGGGDDDDAGPAPTEPDGAATTEPAEAADPTDPTDPDPEVVATTAPGDDPGDTTAGTDAPDDTTASTDASTTTPITAAPPTTVIGDTVTLDDGSIVRVDSVTPDAPPLSEIFPPDPGTSYTRVAVELCAGSDGLSVNPLYFQGFLDDNMSADTSILSHDLASVDLRPGGCSAGTVDLVVPDGRILGSVVMTGAAFDEVARWSTAASNPVGAPLTPVLQPESAALGETVTLDDGATAVVQAVTPNAPPRNDFYAPEPGRQFVDAAVQICAGSAPYSVNPLYWFATMADHFTAGADVIASDLTTIDVAPGQCVAGIVTFEVPATATPAYVLLSGPLFDEIGRWRVG